MENLSPMEGAELESFIAQLEKNVAEKIGEEPKTISSDDFPESGLLGGYTLPNIYTMRDTI